MIFDNIKNANDYYFLSAYFKQAFEYLQNNDLSAYKVGTYPILNQDIFFKIEEYNTQASTNKQYEAHEKYADIQFIISGAEYMSCTDVSAKKVIKPYSAENDIAFFDGEVSNLIQLQAGDFCVFLPNEGHASGIYTDKSVKVKKAIVKINMLNS